MKNRMIKTSLIVFVSMSICFGQTPGFFKDIFVDGGVYLTGMIDFPAAEDLGLDVEYLATDDIGTQSFAMITDDKDSNGHLLYPDGEPRFRLLYTNGGSSTNHGGSLRESGRNRVRTFYANGGSFMGSCAGAFISSVHWDSIGVNEAYYRIWPGRTGRTRLIDSFTAHDIPADSPLLNYFDFGGDSVIVNVRHNGGCYAREDLDFPKHTEILLRYRSHSRPDLNGLASTWAYKPDDEHGRIVVIGSHPEFEQVGEIFELAQAMMLYALDGVGRPQVKAQLKTGELRNMDLFTEDSVPEFTRIGDKQYHHFTLAVPPEARRLTIELDAEDGYDFNLYANLEDFAFENKSLFTSEMGGSDHELIVPVNESGLWYIGVECATTVSSAGPAYWGKTEVLNGVAYSIKATWGTESVVGVDNLAQAPGTFTLFANFPNPFNPSTSIRYELPENAQVSLKIFDVSGRLIQGLVHQVQEAGTYDIRWDGTNSQGLLVPTGVYFARLEAGDFSKTIKMLLLR